MRIPSKLIKRVAKTFLLFLSVAVSRLFKMSLILGSRCAFFSGVNCVMPLSGQFVGSRFGALLLLIPSLLLAFLNNNYYLTFYHIPSIFASFYWSVDSKLLRVGLPLICMALFIFHPVGQGAWVYSLYWLIPIIMSFIAHKNVFYKALGATFSAHAVGSILWLYGTSIPSSVWIALIPVVLVERLAFASGMVLVYKLYSFVKVHGRAFLTSICGNVLCTKGLKK
ncbi:hypothetical protein HN446_04395 [bacterium]|jgi:hypothetical protein|nr:hypothetical protein [bacterium]